MRKTILSIFAVFLPLIFIHAQAPNQMSYQAVVRNTSGNVVSNTGVGLRISILRGSSNGTLVFSETQIPITNGNGLFSVLIGNGNVVTGSISSIDWTNGPYFLKSETDPNGGTNYIFTAVNQLLSVPYALYAQTAGNGDKVVNLTGSGTTTVTGTYPNFTITSNGSGGTTYTAGSGVSITAGNQIVNTSPDIPVVLNGAGLTTVTGAYPNFTINSSGAGGSTYNAGSGVSISGSTRL